MKLQATLIPKPHTDPAAFAPFVLAEERQVWADYEAGFLREMYFQPMPLTVTLVFEVTDVASLQARLAAFPMIEAGLFDITVVELGPWLPMKALFGTDAATLAKA